ncbi:MAG: indole-3-glycerol phosphate synthase TrpC [Planctomycetota bacterium]
MTRFLDQVIKEKQIELARKMRTYPILQMEHRARCQEVRGFFNAIRVRGSIIAEVKKRSPSIKAFPNSVIPEDLARIYANNGASAISVVTDTRNFGTSLADVERIREAVSLPVLVKDFITHSYQIMEARASGADAILLIARILTQERLSDLLGYTHDLGIHALVECHSSEDIVKATAAKACIMGINNRDLDTLEISLETTRTLAALIPEEAICVAESGIQNRQDVVDLLAADAHAFLIGGALLKARDPGAKLRELSGREPESGAPRE